MRDFPVPKMEASVGQDSHVGLHLIPRLEGLDQRREIGRGSFGAVYEVKMNGLPCIAKGLHDILLGRGGNLPIRETDMEAIRAKFHKECSLLGNLKHPNIVQFLGVHQSKDNDEWLVMEYLHMDLARCLEMYPDIPLPLKLSILRDVSYGLLHLHSLAPPIIHRDLTAPNILLTQGMSAKIADLGVSNIFDIRQVQRSAHTAAPGTLAYMPPEALSPDPKYDAKLDVFSYGVLTLYVANQEFPTVYELQIPLVVYKEIQINKRKPWVDKMGVSHPLHSVVMSCLMDHPDHRPTSKVLNDMITKLCAQHDNSCKNVLELIKENEELKKKLEMENVSKIQKGEEKPSKHEDQCQWKIRELEMEFKRLEEGASRQAKEDKLRISELDENLVGEENHFGGQEKAYQVRHTATIRELEHQLNNKHAELDLVTKQLTEEKQRVSKVERDMAQIQEHCDDAVQKLVRSNEECLQWDVVIKGLEHEKVQGLARIQSLEEQVSELQRKCARVVPGYRSSTQGPPPAPTTCTFMLAPNESVTTEPTRICPVCNTRFPKRMYQIEFERHVQGHFSS